MAAVNLSIGDQNNKSLLATLPKITGVFSSRKGRLFKAADGHTATRTTGVQHQAFQNLHPRPIADENMQQASTAWPVIETSYEKHGASTVTNLPIPKINDSFECTRNKLYGNSDFVGIQTGFTSIPRRLEEQVENLFTLGCNELQQQRYWHETGIPRVSLDAAYLQELQKQKTVVASETLSERALLPVGCDGIIRDLREQGSRPSHLDELRRMVPLRFGFKQDPFKETLEANFSEALQEYRFAIRCDNKLSSLIQNRDVPYTNKFTWEDIKHLLDGVPQDFPFSSLSDLIDFPALDFILKNILLSQRDQTLLDEPRFQKHQLVDPSMCRYDEDKRQEKERPWTRRQLSAVEAATHAKNVTSTPYAEKHMETLLHSSSASGNSHNVYPPLSAPKIPEPQTAADVSTNHVVDLEDAGGNFYLGRYPCLRDRSSYSSSGYRSLESDTHVISSDDSSEVSSSDMIVKPRSYPNYNDDYDGSSTSDQIHNSQLESWPTNETEVPRNIELPFSISQCETGISTASTCDTSSNADLTTTPTSEEPEIAIISDKHNGKITLHLGLYLRRIIFIFPFDKTHFCNRIPSSSLCFKFIFFTLREKIFLYVEKRNEIIKNML